MTFETVTCSQCRTVPSAHCPTNWRTGVVCQVTGCCLQVQTTGGANQYIVVRRRSHLRNCPAVQWRFHQYTWSACQDHLRCLADCHLAYRCRFSPVCAIWRAYSETKLVRAPPLDRFVPLTPLEKRHLGSGYAGRRALALTTAMS